MYTGYEYDQGGNPTIPVTLGVAYTPGGTYDLSNLHYIQNSVLENDEVAFAVFTVTEVMRGTRSSPCTIGVTALQIWQAGDGGKEIWGTVAGRTDTQVIFSDPDGDAAPEKYHQDIWAAGDRYNVYFQDADVFSDVYPDGVPLTSGRISGTDNYRGIGHDAAGASLEGTKSELVWAGGSIQACNEDAEIVITDFDPDAFTTDFATHVLLDTGTPWNLTDGPNDTDMLVTFPGPAATDLPVAHLKVASTVEPAGGLGGWDAILSDPMDGDAYVPEPAAAWLLGVAGFSLLRRRRHPAA